MLVLSCAWKTFARLLYILWGADIHVQSNSQFKSLTKWIHYLVQSVYIYPEIFIQDATRNLRDTQQNLCPGSFLKTSGVAQCPSKYNKWKFCSSRFWLLICFKFKKICVSHIIYISEEADFCFINVWRQILLH